MIEIDGSAGGGQVLRLATALSAVSGEAVTVTGVRGARPDPGLGHQHLAAVETLAAIADADTEGADLGSETLEFRPHGLDPGEYEVDIGTAGSITLLFDAVLPLAVEIDGTLAVTAGGGTDVKWSPSTDYYRRIKLPLLRRRGLVAAVDVLGRGFYPRGGGRASLRVAPSSVDLDLPERGERRGARIHSTATEDLADSQVARRQADAAAEALAEAGIGVTERVVRRAAAPSTGSVVAVALDYEHAVAGFDALGEPGKPSEEVAGDAVGPALSFDGDPTAGGQRVDDGPSTADRARAAIDRHLADQVVPFLGLCGGRARVPAVTDHVEAAVEVLAEFGYGIEIHEEEGSVLLVGSG